MYDEKKISYNIGLAIRYLRKKKRMTGQNLAEKSGIARGTVTALETGKCVNVKFGSILGICNGFDISIDEFISICERGNFNAADDWNPHW